MSWKLVKDSVDKPMAEAAVGAMEAAYPDHITPTTAVILGEPKAVWKAAHDAAPSEPTDAVMELVRAAEEAMNAAPESPGANLDEALTRLRTACPGLVEDAMEGEK